MPRKKYSNELPDRLKRLGIPEELATRVAAEMEFDTRKRVKMALRVIVEKLGTPAEIRRLEQLSRDSQSTRRTVAAGEKTNAGRSCKTK